MSQTRPRLGWHALVLAIVMLLVGAASAHATTVAYSGDGTTLMSPAETTARTTSSSAW